MSSSPSIKSLLQKCLKRFGKEDMLQSYIEYLQGEWFNDLVDLRLALDDKDSWANLKLPGRLKLELKQEILLLPASVASATSPAQNSTSSGVWHKCFSVEHDAYYYCNSVTGETQWEEPQDVEIIDNQYCEDFDNSMTVSEVAKANILPSTTVTSTVEPAAPKFSPQYVPISIDTVGLPGSSVSVDKSFLPYPSAPELTYSPTPPPSSSKYSITKSRMTMTMNQTSFPPPPLPSGITGSKPAQRIVLDAAESSDSDSSCSINETLVIRLSEMGFEREIAEYALRKRQNNLSAAAAFLIRLQNGEEKRPDSIPKPTLTPFTPERKETVIVDDIMYDSEEDGSNELMESKPKKGLKLNIFGGTKKSSGSKKSQPAVIATPI